MSESRNPQPVTLFDKSAPIMRKVNPDFHGDGKPNYLREVDLCEDNCDEMPEDGDESCLPDAVQEALEVLNKAIRESRTPEQAISWSPGKTKPKAGSIDITDDLSALVSE